MKPVTRKQITGVRMPRVKLAKGGKRHGYWTENALIAAKRPFDMDRLNKEAARTGEIIAVFDSQLTLRQKG